jgi:hypothetical protein
MGSIQEGTGDIIANIPPNGQELSDAPTRARVQGLTNERVSSDHFSRTRFQHFLSDPPCSSFKKLIILTPRLVQSLRTMSRAKAVPKGIRDKECKRSTLWERPPVPYVPEKDPVQETVPALKSDQSLRTTIGKDSELCLPIWHCGTHKAFLMHVSTALNAIKKQGTFKAYKQACEAYVEQCKAVKQAKAALALLTAPTSKGNKDSEKASRTALRKRRLLRRPRNVQLWPIHQPQNCTRSIRLTTIKPSLLQRPPRTSAKPLLPRCFSSTWTCCLWMPGTRGCRYRFSWKPISTYMSLTLASLCGEWRLVSKNYEARRGKYEARIVIFCILAADYFIAEYCNFGWNTKLRERSFVYLPP